MIKDIDYKFYPALSQVVITGHYKKAEIISIVNISRGLDLYRAGTTLSIQKIVENGIPKTVLKFGKKNPLFKGMEDDDNLVFDIDLSDKIKKEQRKIITDQRKQYSEDVKTQRKNEQERIRQAKEKHIGYYKADTIKKRSLLDLVGENFFEKDKSLGSSIGGAVSDKIRAKGVRIKRAFDPLRLVRALTPTSFGKKIAVTAAGRLFGRSDEAIQYFGGYRRSNKDPKRTKLGPGQLRNLESGDSSADILAKMLNFMMKDHERQKKERELEDNFRKEELEESQRRHEKLVEEIRKIGGGPKAEPAKEDDQQKEIKSFMDTVMGGMKKIVSTLKNMAMLILPFMFGIVEVLKDVAMSFASISGVVGSIVKTVLKSVAGVVRALVVSFFERLIFKEIIGRVWSAFSLVLGFIGQGAFAALAHPLGAVLGIAAAGLAVGATAAAAEDLVTDTQRKAFTSDRSTGPRQQMLDLKSEYEAKREEIRVRRGGDKFFKNFGDEQAAKEEFKILGEWYAKKKADLQAKQNLYFSEFIQPILEREGYVVENKVSPTSKGKAGDLDLPVIKKDGKELTDLEYNALAGKLAILKSVKTIGDEALIDVSNKANDFVSDSVVPQIQNKFENKLKEFENKLKSIPSMFEEPETDTEAEVQNISMNNNNTYGGQAKYSDVTPISPRTRNDSIQLALARTSVVV